MFRALAQRVPLTVFFAHRQTSQQQADAGYGVAFDWDQDLAAGYRSVFLENVASAPGVSSFGGCDTPTVSRDMKAAGCDVTMLMGWNLKSYHQALWGAKRRGVPAIVRSDSQLGTPRSPIKRAVKSLAYPMLLRQFDAALYVGARSKAYYKRYGVEERRLFFAPHCVDEEFFGAHASREAGMEMRKELGIVETEKVVAFVGRLVPFKRSGDVVEALGLLRKRGRQAHLLVAGSGEMDANLKDLAEQRNVRLHMLGFQNQKRLPAVYSAADVLVLPSDANETWGLVANEALVCGTPVVVSDQAGCADDLGKDGKACRRFRTGDVGDLADTLESVFQAPPLKSDISGLAQEYGLSVAVNGVVDAAQWTMRSHHS
jgi:glycosyltransferase involved in cell wall biosynthesis